MEVIKIRIRRAFNKLYARFLNHVKSKWVIVKKKLIDFYNSIIGIVILGFFACVFLFYLFLGCEIIKDKIDEKKLEQLRIEQKIAYVERWEHIMANGGPGAEIVIRQPDINYLPLPEEYTLEDLELLTTMVYCENGKVTGTVEINGVETDACILHQWTAQVCLNHLKNKRINVDSIYEALYYPRYPSYYREEGTAERCKADDYEAWLDCEKDCLMAMNGLVDLPENVIFASNYEGQGSGYFAKVHVKTKYIDKWCYFSYQ